MIKKSTAALLAILFVVITLAIAIPGTYIGVVFFNNRSTTVSQTQNIEEFVDQESSGDKNESPYENSLPSTQDNLVVQSGPFTGKWVGSQDYPLELRDLTSSNLLNLNCSPRLAKNQDGKVVDLAQAPYIINGNDNKLYDFNQFSQELVESYFSSLKNSRINYIASLNVCKGEFTEASKVIDFAVYTYCEVLCGGGVGTQFGITGYQNGLSEGISYRYEMLNPVGAYPYVEKILALSRDQEIYFEIVGGEFKKTHSILKLDLNKMTYGMVDTAKNE